MKSKREEKRKDSEKELKNIDEIEQKDEDLMKKKKDIEQELYKMYDYFGEGAILRSRCTWYEKGEKSTKYCLSLEKGQAVNSSIDVLLSDEGHIDKQNEIQKLIKKSHFKHCLRIKTLWEMKIPKNILARVMLSNLQRKKGTFVKDKLHAQKLGQKC